MLATTSMPTKNGMMRLDVTSAMQAAAESDSSLRTLSSLVSWKVDAKRDFSGSIGFDLSAWRDAANPRDLNAAIDFKPSSLVFNDTVWTMEPSHIGVSKGIIDVDGFRVGRPGQYVEIDGLVTASHEDSVEINLANVDLDYVLRPLISQTPCLAALLPVNYMPPAFLVLKWWRTLPTYLSRASNITSP